MCLSTVYKNKLAPETVMMKNVMRIECKDGVVILTDLMERQMAVEGTLEMANLVDGVAVISAIYGQPDPAAATTDLLERARNMVSAHG